LRPRKILILSILISFACHTIVLSLSSFINMTETKDRGKVITVNLNNSERDQLKPVNPEKTLRGRNIDKDSVEKKTPDDTVDLNNEKSRYFPYLRRIKQKIDNIWKYPGKAFAMGQEGITIVRFSIDKSGSVIASNIMKSSGAELLDHGVIEAVQSASPYEPLPADMKLSRLHIVATFHYKLSE
jgi:TonB family protein